MLRQLHSVLRNLKRFHTNGNEGYNYTTQVRKSLRTQKKRPTFHNVEHRLINNSKTNFIMENKMFTEYYPLSDCPHGVGYISFAFSAVYPSCVGCSTSYLQAVQSPYGGILSNMLLAFLAYLFRQSYRLPHLQFFRHIGVRLPHQLQCVSECRLCYSFILHSPLSQHSRSVSAPAMPS